MKLIDNRTRDGSRHFATLPKITTWGGLCDHILLLPATEMVNFIANWPGRAWIDFQFRQHCFAINACDELFHLYVRDPQCPDLILYQVGCHFEQLAETADKDEPRPITDNEGTIA